MRSRPTKLLLGLIRDSRGHNDQSPQTSDQCKKVYQMEINLYSGADQKLEGDKNLFFSAVKKSFFPFTGDS